jgi:hypothetical protein
MVLHEGQIAEMATGEGKTLVAVLAAYLNALPGTLTNPPVFSSSSSNSSNSSSAPGSSVSPGPPQRAHGAGVHVVTVNDYLAARDAEWMGKVYRWVGSSGSLTQVSCHGCCPEQWHHNSLLQAWSALPAGTAAVLTLPLFFLCCVVLCCAGSWV